MTDTSLFLNKYWLPSGDITEAYDERVKTWAREARFGLPVWRRLWAEMDHVLRGGTQNRASLIALERENIPHIGFVRPAPRTVADFKARIANYVRPNALPEVMQRIIKSNTARRAAWEAVSPMRVEEEEEARREEREEREEREMEMEMEMEREEAEEEAEEERRAMATDLGDDSLRVLHALEALENLESRGIVNGERFGNIDERYEAADRIMDMFNGGRHALGEAGTGLYMCLPKQKIQIQMEDNDASFVKENDCVCCMNPLNMGGVVAFGCNHVTCAECAPKVIKMVAANCPMCRQKISTIKFTRDMPTTTYNTLFSAVM